MVKKTFHTPFGDLEVIFKDWKEKDAIDVDEWKQVPKAWRKRIEEVMISYKGARTILVTGEFGSEPKELFPGVSMIYAPEQHEVFSLPLFEGQGPFGTPPVPWDLPPVSQMFNELCDIPDIDEGERAPYHWVSRSEPLPRDRALWRIAEALVARYGACAQAPLSFEEEQPQLQQMIDAIKRKRGMFAYLSPEDKEWLIARFKAQSHEEDRLLRILIKNMHVDLQLAEQRIAESIQSSPANRFFKWIFDVVSLPKRFVRFLTIGFATNPRVVNFAGRVRIFFTRSSKAHTDE